MANVNVESKRLESGSVIKITPVLPTGSEMTLISLAPGTFKWTVPVRQAIEHIDRGVHGVPLEGDDVLGEVEFDIKAGPVGASELVPVLTANGPSSSTNAGRKATFTIVVDIPIARGGSTGARRTFANFVLTDPPSFQAGQDFDIYKLKGKYITYTEATY